VQGLQPLAYAFSVLLEPIILDQVGYSDDQQSDQVGNSEDQHRAYEILLVSLLLLSGWVRLNVVTILIRVEPVSDKSYVE
jgi:hypothetical protein